MLPYTWAQKVPYCRALSMEWWSTGHEGSRTAPTRWGRWQTRLHLASLRCQAPTSRRLHLYPPASAPPSSTPTPAHKHTGGKTLLTTQDHECILKLNLVESPTIQEHAILVSIVICGFHCKGKGQMPVCHVSSSKSKHNFIIPMIRWFTLPSELHLGSVWYLSGPEIISFDY